MPAREARNKQVIIDLLKEIDRRNLHCLEDFYHHDYVEHNSESIKNHTPGIEGVRFGFTAFIQAFDPYHHKVEDLLAEGDKVSARITFTGVFARPLFGFPPTGKRVSATGIAIYKITDGRIKEKWGYFNAMEYLGLSKQAAHETHHGPPPKG